MLSDYIVLDLETPNRFADSMCSIGIVVVKDNVVVDEIYTLINPEAEFDSFNISFTGIGPEDVIDAPTFPEFFDRYRHLLTGNVIVGQNITFDLSVISKALTRYNLPIPPFRYYCTLRSLKRNFNLPDNSLGYVVTNVLDTTYNAHHAMDDARMTNRLYEYLGDYENRSDFLKTYYYRPNCKRDFDRNLDYNYNYLYGLIQKLSYTNSISQNHRKLLQTWYESNNFDNYHPLIENVILKVSYMISYELTQEEIRQITQSLNPIKRSPEYKVVTLRLQALKGIIDSMTCEEKLEKEDVNYLLDWINNRNINDKEFKKFKKNMDIEDKNVLKKQLEEYSRFLEDYLERLGINYFW